MSRRAFWKRKPKTALERLYAKGGPEPFKALPRWRCACWCHEIAGRYSRYNCGDCGHITQTKKAVRR